MLKSCWMDKSFMDNPFAIEIPEDNGSLMAFKKLWDSKPNKRNFDSGSLRIAVNDVCNLTCSYCYNEGIMNLRYKTVSPQDINFMLESIKGDIKSIKLVGGEPLMHPKIIDLIKVCKQYANTTITTNGVFIKKLAGELVASGIDGITISLDSLDPKRFRTLTHTSDNLFTQIMDGIIELKKLDHPPLQLNALITTENFSDVINLIKFADEQGFKRINLLTLISIDPVSKNKIVKPPQIEEFLESRYGKGTHTTTTRSTYFSKDLRVDVVWQYCTTGCKICGTDGFIRVTPDYKFKWCISETGEVPFASELKSRDAKGIKDKFLQTIENMGVYPGGPEFKSPRIRVKASGT